MEVWPYGWFQKKNILQTVFKGKHFSQENSYTEKKNLSWCIILEKKILHLCMSGKKTLSPEVWETNYYPKQITHSPLPPSPQKSNGKNLSFGSLSSQRVHSHEFTCITGRYWKLLSVFIRTGEVKPNERYKARLKVEKEHRKLSTFMKNAIDLLCLNTKKKEVRSTALWPNASPKTAANQKIILHRPSS